MVTFEETMSGVGQIGCWNAKIGLGLVAVGRSSTCIARSRLASSKLGLRKIEGMRVDWERRKAKEEVKKRGRKGK